MKVHHLLALTPLLLAGVSSGQSSGMWSTPGSAAPAFDTGLLAVIVDGASGSATAGNWSLGASGRTQIIATLLDIGSRAQTSVTSDSLVFRINNRVALGGLNLENLLGAGVAMGWSATYNQSGFVWAGNQTTYTYSATILTPQGLLTNVADLGSSITFRILDGNNTVLASLTGTSFLNALGIGIAQDGSLLNLSSSNTYTLNATFQGGNYANGIKYSYEANSLVNTSLLGIGDTVLQVSNISVVPEPTTPLLSATLFGLLAFTRRRRNG